MSRKTKTQPLRLEWVEAGSLTDNPLNWRRHPAEQIESLREVLEDPEIGWAGACLWNEQTQTLLDGHARKNSVSPETPIPVLIGSWSEEAEAKILLTLSPIGGMAGADKEVLERLLGKVNFGTSALASLMTSQRALYGIGQKKTNLKPIEIKKPPAMTWVMVGIPTVRFGEIAEQVERFASIDGLVLETTANDGKRKGE